MKNGTSMDHFHCTKFSKLWHHCKKKQKKNFWNLYFQECWCEFYPSIWPIELCIWNVWSLNLTGPFDLQQSKQQTSPKCKKPEFFRWLQSTFSYTCKQKSHIFNNKEFHLFPPLSDKKARWKKIALISDRRWNGSILLKRRFYKWFTCLGKL